MPTLLRFFHVLRKGPNSRRMQAWVGLVLITGASLWLIIEFLLPLLGIILLAVVGFALIRRSLRESRPSSR